DPLVDLSGPPRIWLVFVDRSAGLQHRIDNTPRLFHIVLPGKQGGVSLHRIPENFLVGIHLLCAWMTAPHNLYGLSGDFFPGGSEIEAKGSGGVGIDPKPEVI